MLKLRFYTITAVKGAGKRFYQMFVMLQNLGFYHAGQPLLIHHLVALSAIADVRNSPETRALW